MTTLPKRTDTASRLTYLEKMVNDLTRQQGAQVGPTGSGYVVNVKDLGAVGDGATNDQTAFAAAMTQICDMGGGTIYVPPGTYVINGVVELCSNLTILGDGATITKTVWSPYSVFVALSHGNTGYGSSVKNVYVSGLRFLGAFASNQSLCGFALHHASDVTVERCVFEQAQGTGHCFDLCGCDGILINDCDFLGFNNHLTGGFNRAEAIEVDVSQNGALSYPDDDGSYDGLLTKDVTVTNCRFLPITVGATTYPCPNPIGAHAQREGQEFRNISFVNNLVLDPTTDLPPSTGDNSWLVGVIHFPTVNGLLIAGNTFRQTTGRMQRVVAVVSRSVGTLASSDPNVNPPTEGAWAAPVISRNIVIRDNTIVGFAPTTQAASQPAVYVAGVVDGKVGAVVVAGNSIRDGRDGTNGGNFAVFMENVTRGEIVGNAVYNCQLGFHVKGSDTVTVSANALDQLYDWTMLFTTDTCIAVTGNTVRRYRRPIQTQSDTTDVSVTGNVFISPQVTGNNANGIVISGSSRYVVSGNTISNDGAVQPRAMAVGAGTNGVVVGNTSFGFTVFTTGVPAVLANNYP